MKGDPSSRGALWTIGGGGGGGAGGKGFKLETVGLPLQISARDTKMAPSTELANVHDSDLSTFSSVFSTPIFSFSRRNIIV